MKVSIKDLSVAMDVKNNGVEFTVYSNDDKFLGDLYVTKSGLIWCQGKTSRDRGVRVNWEEFMEWMNG